MTLHDPESDFELKHDKFLYWSIFDLKWPQITPWDLEKVNSYFKIGFNQHFLALWCSKNFFKYGGFTIIARKMIIANFPKTYLNI